jgi:hypothetical protein
VDYLKEKGIYGQVRAEMEAGEYELERAPQLASSNFNAGQSPETYLANNPAQNLSARFSANQVQLESLQDNSKQVVLQRGDRTGLYSAGTTCQTTCSDSAATDHERERESQGGGR